MNQMISTDVLPSGRVGNGVPRVAMVCLDVIGPGCGMDEGGLRLVRLREAGRLTAAALS